MSDYNHNFFSHKLPRTEVKADPEASADEEQEQDESGNDQCHLANTAMVPKQTNPKTPFGIFIRGVFLLVCLMFLFWTWWFCERNWTNNGASSWTSDPCVWWWGLPLTNVYKVTMMRRTLRKQPLLSTFSGTFVMKSDVLSWTGTVGFASLDNNNSYYQSVSDKRIYNEISNLELCHWFLHLRLYQPWRWRMQWFILNPLRYTVPEKATRRCC